MLGTSAHRYLSITKVVIISGKAKHKGVYFKTWPNFY